MDIRELAPVSSLAGYSKKAEAVLEATKDHEFVYVHLKGPDEPGHDGLRDEKARRISDIDQGFFSILANDGLNGRVLCVTCDHSTPWTAKGHSDDPVPVLVRHGGGEGGASKRFTEAEAAQGSLGLMNRGSLLMERLVSAS